MALTCKQAAGTTNLSATVGTDGASLGEITVYNADNTPTTFTYNFIDASEGDLSIVLGKFTIGALRTGSPTLPRIILNQGDTLQVVPSAGGGTHQYTYNYSQGGYRFGVLAISKALKVSSTTPTTLLQDANMQPNINIFNNKNLLSDIPVFTFSNGILSNIIFKQSLAPYEGVTVRLPGNMLVGDSFTVKSAQGSSDFDIYMVSD